MTTGRRNRASALCALVLVTGLGAATLALTDAGAGEGRAAPRSSAHARTGYAPDPAPIRSADQWLLTFQYRRGKVRLLSARLVRLRRPITTPRRIGRYAVELLSGPTVIERLRFDFPLLGADELAGKRRPYHAPPRFETKATVTYRVMLPDTSRASRARLVDRATGESFMIPWPPRGIGQPPASATASAPAPPKPRRDAGPDARLDARPDASTDASDADAPSRPDVLRRPDAKHPDAAPLDGGTRR